MHPPPKDLKKISTLIPKSFFVLLSAAGLNLGELCYPVARSPNCTKEEPMNIDWAYLRKG